jgi:hypothetical protein
VLKFKVEEIAKLIINNAWIVERVDARIVAGLAAISKNREELKKYYHTLVITSKDEERWKEFNKGVI